MGKRDHQTTDALIEGMRQVTAPVPFQITTDGFAPYCSAVTTTLYNRITDFTQLIKVYRASQEGEARYSPAEVASVEGRSVLRLPACFHDLRKGAFRALHHGY